MTEEQVVYNARGSTAGSSGEDQEANYDKRSPSSPAPVAQENVGSDWDQLDTTESNLVPNYQPAQVRQARRLESSVRIYSHSIDPRYRKLLADYLQQLGGRLNAINLRLSKTPDRLVEEFEEQINE